MKINIPLEVKAQMKKARVLKSDVILTILEEAPFGQATLDALIRNYYLQEDELMVRHSMVQQLYAMCKTGLAYRVAPGVYKITEKGLSNAKR